MAEIAQHVLYEAPQNVLIAVKRIAEPTEIGFSEASAAVSLLEESYRYEFEEPRGRLPEGTFKKHFDVVPYNNYEISQRRIRMQKKIADGSQYWYIADGSEAESSAWRGLALVSPSRANTRQKLGLQSPNCYVNDVVVSPMHQNQGRGGALLHAALAFSGFDQERQVALDLFDDKPNALNSRIVRLGFKATGVLSPYQVADELVLPQTRYSSENIASIGEVADNLLRAAKLIVRQVA